LHTFFDVGSALLTIRDCRLYRTTHLTFENYCRERWGISRSYAWRVIGAAERVKLLPPKPDIPKPSNGLQMRPFFKLRPEQFPKTWQQTIQKAKDGKVTPELVREIVAEISPNTRPALLYKPSRKKPRGRLGQVLALIGWTFAYVICVGPAQAEIGHPKRCQLATYVRFKKGRSFKNLAFHLIFCGC